MGHDADVIDSLSRRIKDLEAHVAEKDGRIRELEIIAAVMDRVKRSVDLWLTDDDYTETHLADDISYLVTPNELGGGYGSELIELLREKATEIALEGINGWGNTMTDAAERIAELEAIIQQHSMESLKDVPADERIAELEQQLAEQHALNAEMEAFMSQAEMERDEALARTAELKRQLEAAEAKIKELEWQIVELQGLAQRGE